jgi:hypothetical protein
MPIYKIFVEKCVIQPSAVLMKQAYDDYLDDSDSPTKESIKEASSPCKDRTITNQCAVRMSRGGRRRRHGLHVALRQGQRNLVLAAAVSGEVPGPARTMGNLALTCARA